MSESSPEGDDDRTHLRPSADPQDGEDGVGTNIPIDVGGSLISLATADHFSDSLRRVVISPGDSARPAVISRRSALISGMPNSAAVAAQLAS